jgi:hypothetical protein
MNAIALVVLLRKLWRRVAAQAWRVAVVLQDALGGDAELVGVGGDSAVVIQPSMRAELTRGERQHQEADQKRSHRPTLPDHVVADRQLWDADFGGDLSTSKRDAHDPPDALRDRTQDHRRKPQRLHRRSCIEEIGVLPVGRSTSYTTNMEVRMLRIWNRRGGVFVVRVVGLSIGHGPTLPETPRAARQLCRYGHVVRQPAPRRGRYARAGSIERRGTWMTLEDNALFRQPTLVSGEWTKAGRLARGQRRDVRGPDGTVLAVMWRSTLSVDIHDPSGGVLVHARESDKLLADASLIFFSASRDELGAMKPSLFGVGAKIYLTNGQRELVARIHGVGLNRAVIRDEHEHELATITVERTRMRRALCRSSVQFGGAISPDLRVLVTAASLMTYARVIPSPSGV